MLSRFHLIPERQAQTDGRTDGQTDRQTDAHNCYINIARQSVLTRDKSGICKLPVLNAKCWSYEYVIFTHNYFVYLFVYLFYLLFINRCRTSEQSCLYTIQHYGGNNDEFVQI